MEGETKRFVNILAALAVEYLLEVIAEREEGAAL